MALLEVEDLRRYYGRNRTLSEVFARRPAPPVRAVDDVSFELQRGEMLALVGESGCGKTTTAQTVLRLINPTSGTISFAEQDITTLRHRDLRPLRRRMQIVYQDPYESLNPRYRVSQTLIEPLEIHGLGGSSAERRELALEALRRVELQPAERFLDRYPHELSGGQRQRVAIAAALIVGPELLIADEPVSMLDVSVRAGVMGVLKRLCQEDRVGILMITHDLPLAAHFADRVAVMYLGRIVEVGGARQVLRDPRHPYTRALRDVAPRRGRERTERAQILKGEPANAAAIPAGCRFHPRCPRAEDVCSRTDVRLMPVAGAAPGHEAACLFADDIRND
ncbi:MAG TPA: ABC transporter ATP-binding protein [Solirubrobacteraceae bacterium]|jgi:peptide/nickel transport system ATP-binding protein|nr:ABC transporter ATP-binding protein [Solirubrobacteraceae bacterium]